MMVKPEYAAAEDKIQCASAAELYARHSGQNVGRYHQLRRPYMVAVQQSTAK